MLSAYELAREAKILANRDLLRQLDIDTALAGAPVTAPKQVTAKRSREPKAPKIKPEFVERRVSLRVAGLVVTEEELKVKREVEAVADEEDGKRARIESRKDIELDVLLKIGGSGPRDEALALLKTLPAKGSKQKGSKTAAIDVEATSSSSAALQSLKAVINSSKLRTAVKIGSERIYSMIVHPSVERDLVFVGIKWGEISLWDATEAREKEKPAKDEEGLSKGKFYSWNSHGKHAISALRLDPVNQSHVYSCAYDCAVRKLDFETGVSIQMINGFDFDLDEPLMHGLDISHDGHSVWASDHQGGIYHRDVRQAMKTTQRWTIDRYKVGAFSLNPVDSNYAVTAHLKKDMCLWDIRKIQSMKESASTDNAQLASFEHGASCSSAYFSPCGSKILTTSYDDHMRVWDVDRAKIGQVVIDQYMPKHVLSHDNQTGRYLTVFKAQWSPSPHLPAHFNCGNMKRSLDIVSSDCKYLAQLKDPVVSAVPAVTASHPVIAGRYYGGNGSGKVSLFSSPQDGDDQEQE